MHLRPIEWESLPALRYEPQYAFGKEISLEVSVLIGDHSRQYIKQLPLNAI